MIFNHKNTIIRRDRKKISPLFFRAAAFGTQYTECRIELPSRIYKTGLSAHHFHREMKDASI